MNRFSFPGAELVSVQDTSTHEIEVVKIKEGGHVFLLDMIRRAGLPYKGDFLVASVDAVDGGNLWLFKDANHDGLGLLASTTEGAVIALVGPGRCGAVERVISLKSLADHIQPDVARVVKMKEEAAKYLGRDHSLSGVEHKMFEVLIKRRQAAEAEAKAQAEAERRRLREERVQEILSRAELTVFTVGGRQRHGIPVIKTEWPMLPHGTHVVLVDKIGDEGELGKALSAFTVHKAPGRDPIPNHSADVIRSVGVETKTQPPQPLYSVLAEREGEFHEVQIYPDMDTIRTARAAGLNSGTKVAVKPEGETVEVYAVRTEDIQTLGKFMVR